MVYFMRIKNKMRDALIEFCSAQTVIWNVNSKRKIEQLVDSVFEPFNKFKGIKLSPVTVRGFTLYGDEADMSSVSFAVNNTSEIIMDSGIYLCTMFVDGTDKVDGKEVTNSYELYYDINNEVIRLIYHVEIVDNLFIASYRSDVISTKDFNLYGFVRSFAAQFTKHLESLFPAKKRTYNRKKKEDDV